MAQSDSSGFVGLVVVGLLVLVAIGLISAAVSRARDRRYAEQVSAWAAGLGWRFREGGGGTWTGRMPQGIRNGVRLLVEGSHHGYPVSIAHYWWQTRENHPVTRTTYVNGQTRTETRWETRIVNHDATVHIVHLPEQLASVTVTDRGLGSRMARALGMSKSADVGDAEFDRRFRVETDDPAGMALMTHELVRAHVDAIVPLWSVDGRDLLSVQDNARLRTDTALAYLDGLVRVADLLTRRRA
ncbi:hypothetical protein [Allorhizocola rhizosphaerae]|uniref:hypothetical protein n=1 Tax=Allorhizocola rhizosphaerae TaxID=1872709 RepID=UPI000E3D952D|nr:hypothetical protein [Allorhizocola rhizosphaerae]